MLACKPKITFRDILSLVPAMIDCICTTDLPENIVVIKKHTMRTFAMTQSHNKKYSVAWYSSPCLQPHCHATKSGDWNHPAQQIVESSLTMQKPPANLTTFVSTKQCFQRSNDTALFPSSCSAWSNLPGSEENIIRHSNHIH